MPFILDKIGISSREMTDEGFLVIKSARIARSGIQEYFAGELGMTDKEPFQIIKVYRPKKEVFNKDSMESFANKPVTNNHPNELVNIDNYKELSKGHSGDTISQDGIFLTAKLVVTDSAAIADIESGKVELSNGYTSELTFKPGRTDDGELYDAIQTDIRGNHIAIVEKGRCGSQCKISDSTKKPTEEIDMPKVFIDGVEFEAPEQTAQAVNKVLKDAENAKTAKEEAEDELEKEKKKSEKMETDHKAALDTIQAKLDDAETNKVTPEMLDSLASKRMDVIAVAGKVIENFDATGKDCDTIRKEVVQVVAKDRDLTKDSPEYIAARFDAIADSTSSQNSMNDGLSQHAIAMNDGKGSKGAAEDSRQKMIDRNKDAWKKQA